MSGRKIPAARKAARQVTRITSKYSTAKEGAGVVRKVSSKGLSPVAIRRTTRLVRRELGANAAVKYNMAAKKLDKTTSANPNARKAARKASKKVVRRQGS